MFASSIDREPDCLNFLLLPRFAMLAFFSALEPLRVANRLAGRTLFRWRVFSLDGEAVTASNDMTILADAPFWTADSLSNIIVCSSFEPECYETPDLLSRLRRLERQGAAIGALDTGCHPLAVAGLLDVYRVTMHWESIPAFMEEFPHIEVTYELFETDRDRYTCAGGTAALDMMLHQIATKHGHDLAVGISEQFIHDRIRNRSDHQRMQLSGRLGVHHPSLLRMVEAMEANIEEPLGPKPLAALGGVSLRQAERLFCDYLTDTPTGYYRKLRLSRARQLLQQTSMSVTEVGMACGFPCASYFSRAYRAQFGRPPRADRRSVD